jgi:hypothetical protein
MNHGHSGHRADARGSLHHFGVQVIIEIPPSVPRREITQGSAGGDGAISGGGADGGSTAAGLYVASKCAEAGFGGDGSSGFTLVVEVLGSATEGVPVGVSPAPRDARLRWKAGIIHDQKTVRNEHLKTICRYALGKRSAS